MRHFVFVLASLFAIAAPSTAQVPKPIPVADLAAQPTLTEPELSPDGKRLAAVSIAGDITRLVLIDTAQPNAKPKVYSFGKAPMSSLRWAGNNRLLARFVNRVPLFGSMYPLTRLFIIDVNSGRGILADPNSKGLVGGEVIYADPAGHWALIVSQDTIFDTPSVKRVNLADGSAVQVEAQRPNVWDWYADEKGTVRAGLAYDEKRWKLWYRENPGEELRTVRGKFEPDDGSNVDKVIFGNAKDKATVITNERTGRFAVYEYDLVRGEVGKAIFEHPVVDIESVWSDPLSSEIVGVRYHLDGWKTHWIEPKLKALQAKLDRALPGRNNDIVSRSRNNDTALVWSGSAADPGTYYVLDLKSSKMSPVMLPYDRIDAEQLSTVKRIQYTARDGLNVPAYLTLPKGRGEKQLPLIMLPHGGPFAQDEMIYDPLVQFFANRGYAVLQPQFRGTTGYGRSHVESGYGEWGRKMQDDLDDGLDWAVRQGIVDPKRVCIVGASYGGYAALWGAIRNPERYRCAASYAGVTDIGMQLKANRRSMSATRYFRRWRTKVQGDSRFDLKDVSPLAQAGRLRIPVMVVHGENDDTVDVAQGRKMVDALRKSGADVTPIFYKEGGHGFEDSEDFADFLSRLETFLARHNPAAP